MIKRLVILLILLGSVYASCSGSISQNVPAVVGSSGGLVNVTMTMSPGIGNVYVSINPRIGTMTQDSIETAIKYAKKISNNSQTCDTYMTFGTPDSEGLIDGPSAGAAITTMTYALINNQSMRQDTIITGTINEVGDVGPVGGVYEKVKGAVANGAKYFISPLESVYDRLMLKKLEAQYGITILQAETENEVIGFMLYNRTIPEPDVISKNRPIPRDIPQYNSTGIEIFRSISNAFLQKETREINNLGNDSDQANEIKTFYQNEIERQTTILDKGYYFSAANEAFLNYIDMMTVEAINSPRIDIARKKTDVNDCINKIQKVNMTNENFELVIGADLRKAWAANNIEKVEVKGTDLVEDKFKQYNMLSYSQAWCEVANELILAAQTVNRTAIVDQNDLKEQSAITLQKATDELGNSTNEDLKSRLSIATELNKNGKYGASIFDSVYVIEMSKLASGNTNDLQNKSSQLINQTRNSLWGKVYQSQAAFLYQQKDYAGSYKIARVATGLDEAVDKIKINLLKENTTLTTNNPDTTNNQRNSIDNNNQYIAIGLALLAVVAILAIGTKVIKGDGNGRAYNQRARKAYRA